MNGAKAEPCRAGLWLWCAPKNKKNEKMGALCEQNAGYKKLYFVQKKLKM